MLATWGQLPKYQVWPWLKCSFFVNTLQELPLFWPFIQDAKPLVLSLTYHLPMAIYSFGLKHAKNIRLLTDYCTFAAMNTSQNFIHNLVDNAIAYLFVDANLSIRTVNQITLASSIVLALLFFWLTSALLHRLFKTQWLHRRFSSFAQGSFVQSLFASKVPYHLANLIPIMVISACSDAIWGEFPVWASLLLAIVDAIFVVFLLHTISAVLRATCAYLKNNEYYKYKPLESYAQIVMMVLYFIAMAFLYIKFTNKSLTGFFGALGAISAVLLLMFKDTIMGVVTSIQVSMNDMVRVGDWVTMKNYGADGTVSEINLTTVKVVNFDHTVTTIPTYSLISSSFQNWRYMSDSGARRICRHLLIRPSSVRFLQADDLATYEKIQLIAQYIDTKRHELAKYNDKNHIDTSHPLNGRHLTNLGLYRKYIDAYIKQHAALHKDKTIMVRQLQSTQYGIPLEIYAFSKDTVTQQYEYIQADLFDHIFAAAQYFDLHVYEA